MWYTGVLLVLVKLLFWTGRLDWLNEWLYVFRFTRHDWSQDGVSAISIRISPSYITTNCNYWMYGEGVVGATISFFVSRVSAPTPVHLFNSCVAKQEFERKIVQYHIVSWMYIYRILGRWNEDVERFKIYKAYILIFQCTSITILLSWKHKCK